MYKPTLLQLESFLALVAAGSYAAAGERLNKSHPSVFAAVKGLEDMLGLVLLDRSGYRVTLTPAGERFHAEAKKVLAAHGELARHAEQLRTGVEPELRIVIGDLCPLAQVLATITEFFSGEPQTRPIITRENIAGPWARLLRGEADLVIHHLPPAEPEFESLYLFDVPLVPVAAPGFPAISHEQELTPSTLRAYRQCVISDSAADWQPTSYHLLDGAPTVIVDDQTSKLEVLRQGLAWGHMPLHMVVDDLAAGRLRSLQGEHLPGACLPHYAMRRGSARHGPVAGRLWDALRLPLPPSRD